MRCKLKRVVVTLFVFAMIGMFSACGLSESCVSCGETPTKGYKNNYSGEKEYYCSECSSDCVFCAGEATEYYTSALGIIIFACDDCYKDIQELND